MLLIFVPSHVAKTGDIKDFVILEESGIAKGIRRVIAVTGHEATEAKRVAEALKTRLDQLEAASGKEKDAGLKAYTFVSSSVGWKCRCMPKHTGCRNSGKLISPPLSSQNSGIVSLLFAKPSISRRKTRKLPPAKLYVTKF